MASNGVDLLEAAKKKAERRGWFGSSMNLESAADLYGQAGDAFKLEMRWESAAGAYVSQAKILYDLKQDFEASSAYLSAAVCYKKINATAAIDNYNKSIEICKKTGRLHMAASSMKQVADLYENELGNKNEAAKAFVTAASWYIAEDSTAQANSCILRAAHLEAELNRYEEAVKHFEQAIENSKICTGDFEGAYSAVAEYKKIDETYIGTRECNFIDKILEIASESKDVDQFVQVVSSWDRITKLDSWKTSLLLIIKGQLSQIDYT